MIRNPEIDVKKAPRTYKTRRIRSNSQMRVLCRLNHGAKIVPMRQYTRRKAYRTVRSDWGSSETRALERAPPAETYKPLVEQNKRDWNIMQMASCVKAFIGEKSIQHCWLSREWMAWFWFIFIPLSHWDLSIFEEPGHMVKPAIDFQLYFAPAMLTFYTFKHGVMQSARAMISLGKSWRWEHKTCA